MNEAQSSFRRNGGKKKKPSSVGHYREVDYIMYM